MLASTDTSHRRPRRGFALAFVLMTTLLGPLGAGAQSGPVVRFLGVTNSQDALIASVFTPQGQVFPIPSTGFHIVVEGARGASQQDVATSTVGTPNDPNGSPDFQILVDHDLGAGSPQVCDMSPLGAGGVPAEGGFSDSQGVTDALNDFGCYFTAHGSDDACVELSPGNFGFVSAAQVQFCSVPIPPLLRFPAGNTMVSVRLRDVNGVVGPIMHMTLQVAGPTMPPTTPSATPTPTGTALLPTATPTAPSDMQTPAPTITDTPTLGPPSTPTPSPTPVPCVGDCNLDLQVTVDEFLAMVNIALGNAESTFCLAGDANLDQQITIDEVLTAVNNALNGCPGVSAAAGYGTPG
jgi:hypothetical protein